MGPPSLTSCNLLLTACLERLRRTVSLTLQRVSATRGSNKSASSVPGFMQRKKKRSGFTHSEPELCMATRSGAVGTAPNDCVLAGHLRPEYVRAIMVVKAGDLQAAGRRT